MAEDFTTPLASTPQARAAEVAAKAVSTIGTVLKFGTEAASLTQLCKIKGYPALGGEPEQIETTDLEDKQQTYVPGVQAMILCNLPQTIQRKVMQRLKLKKEHLDIISWNSEMQVRTELLVGKDSISYL